MTQTTPALAVVMEYTATFDALAVTHAARYRCAVPAGDQTPAPGSDPALVNISTRGTLGTPGTISVLTGASEYVAALLPALSDSISITTMSLVSYPQGLSGQGIYVAPIDLSDGALFPSLVGGNISKGVPASQEIYTWRDDRGRTSRTVIMENAATNGVNGQSTYPQISADGQALIDYLLSANAWIKGGGNSTLLTFNKRSNGQNEAAWRKRYR